MVLSEHIVYQEYGNYLILNQINSVKPTTKKELLRRLQMAKDYMDQYFLEIEGIKEIAEYCSLSEYHFYRRFKEVYQMTPNQYLTQKKLVMARDLLRQQDYTVTQIALMCSYPDVFTFSKAFKRLYGLSPSDARS
jgi:AraC family transcriptional regulator